ncbi:MAG: PhoH family protein, partial [Betaproteobacteria bacterium]|nr:PhoH family protein [Betaproteobacteria bacterium]
MPLPPAPRKPATLIDLETIAKQRKQSTRKKDEANDEVANAQTPQASEIAPVTWQTTDSLTMQASAPAPSPLHEADLSEKSAPAKTASGRRKKAKTSASRLFVLDTNVLLHDPSSLFRFDEHDVYLPMITLEELDAHKKGMSEVSRHARQISRSLDQLMQAAGSDPALGMSLDALGNSEASGKLLIQTQGLKFDLPAGLPEGKADNQILGVVKSLQASRSDRQVVLVSKDINMRIKARALGLTAEDYLNDQVLEDTDLLYSGMTALPADFWESHGKGVESWQQSGYTFYRIQGPLVPSLRINEYIYIEGTQTLHAIVREIVGRRAVLQTLRDYGHPKHAVWGITARNREQNFAMNLLMDPQVDFVSLLGQAGTGKTLLALAAGLEQVIEARRYSEIIMTRATVPVG